MAKDRAAEARALFEDLEKPAESQGPPDLLILDKQVGFSVNGTLRVWAAGVPIRSPADIADLAQMPGERFQRMK